MHRPYVLVDTCSRVIAPCSRGMLSLKSDGHYIPSAVSAQKPGTFTGAYSYISCSANAVVVPENTKQLSDIVKQYYARAKTGVPVTIRSSRQ